MAVFEVLGAWFVISLTGALAPGPLSAAVVQNATRRGWAHGMLPMVGHSLVEAVIIGMIVVSLQAIVLSGTALSRVLGAGGLAVVLFGLVALRDYRFQPADPMDGDTVPQAPLSAVGATVQGAVVSVLSPYFILWWSAVGLSTVTSLVMELSVGAGTVVFVGLVVFLVHISTDLIYGAFLSLGTHAARTKAVAGGINWLNVFIGVFQVGLGAWSILRALLP